VHHTNSSVKFCKCGICVKKRREEMLDPENAGKTAKQMVHEGKWGLRIGSVSDNCCGYLSALPSARRLARRDPDFRELTDEHKQKREAVARGFPALVGLDTPVAEAAEEDEESASPAAARSAHVVLGDFLVRACSGRLGRGRGKARAAPGSAAAGAATPHSTATDDSWTVLYH